MRITLAQVDSLSSDDSVPDLVNLYASAHTVCILLVFDTSPIFQAVSTTPQPTYGCTFSSPSVVDGLKVNVVFQELNPPSRLLEQTTNPAALKGAPVSATLLCACSAVLIYLDLR